MRVEEEHLGERGRNKNRGLYSLLLPWGKIQVGFRQKDVTRFCDVNMRGHIQL